MRGSAYARAASVRYVEPGTTRKVCFSYHVYDQAEHVFIFYDPDRDNQRRYSEIGDVDPVRLVELTRQLETRTVADGSTISEALYFRRSGNQLSIVGIE